MPIRPLLESEKGVFAPEDIAAITVAFDKVLDSLGLLDRKDPAVAMVARITLDIAKEGERDPERLSTTVLKRISGH